MVGVRLGKVASLSTVVQFVINTVMVPISAGRQMAWDQALLITLTMITMEGMVVIIVEIVTGRTIPMQIKIAPRGTNITQNTMIGMQITIIINGKG